MSKRVGKKRSTVTNYLRLLRLPPIIQAGIRDRMLSMGHARALVNISDEDLQLKLYKEILSKGLSVRQVEEEVKRLQSDSSSTPEKKKGSIEVHKPLSNELSMLLDAGVKVKEKTNGSGEIVIHFSDQAELERIVSLINP